MLSKALGEKMGRWIIPKISRYGMPVFEALVKIGRPAIPAMIENIKNSDNERLRDDSMLVLYHVLGGKKRLLELFSKLSDKAVAEKPPDRKAAERFQKARVGLRALQRGRRTFVLT